MTISIELPEDTLTALRADAESQGRRVEDVAAEHLAVVYTPEDDLMAALEEGYIQLDAGQGQNFDEFAAELRTRFETRYSEDKVK